jgi:hypothetical protein
MPSYTGGSQHGLTEHWFSCAEALETAASENIRKYRRRMFVSPSGSEFASADSP